MNSWDTRDLALIEVRKEAIKIIEDFEGRNIGKENYQEKLDCLLNKKLGKKVRTLTKFSINTTVKNLISPWRSEMVSR